MVSIEIISIHVILERQSRLYLCMDDYMCIYIWKYWGIYKWKYWEIYVCIYGFFVYMYIQAKRSHECEKQKSGCM